MSPENRQSSYAAIREMIAPLENHPFKDKLQPNKARLRRQTEIDNRLNTYTAVKEALVEELPYKYEQDVLRESFDLAMLQNTLDARLKQIDQPALGLSLLQTKLDVIQMQIDTTKYVAVKAVPAGTFGSEKIIPTATWLMTTFNAGGKLAELFSAPQPPTQQQIQEQFDAISAAREATGLTHEQLQDLSENYFNQDREETKEIAEQVKTDLRRVFRIALEAPYQ